MNLSLPKLYERYKKMYDPMYTFSICQESDINDVVEFIDNYWKKGHILVKSRQLLDWQYKNDVTKTYNFVIARSRKTDEIHAIEGFIPTTQFDHSIKNAMTWGAIWKTIPDVAPPGLGFVVKQYREDNYGTKYNCEVGISPDARKYNSQFGNAIFELSNWYIVNPYKKDYELIEVSNNKKEIRNYSDKAISYNMLSYSEWEKMSKHLSIPEYKSKLYYINRYFKHPVYKYCALVLTDERSKKQEAMFYRIADYQGNHCVFIVDYIGDSSVLAKSYNILLDIMKQTDAEYILFPCHGIDACFLQKAGFINSKQTQDIIPMYYEPFLKQNITIICASKNPIINWCSFKGDSDQDRPNLA